MLSVANVHVQSCMYKYMYRYINSVISSIGATAPLNVQVAQGFLVSLEVTWEPPMFPNGIIDGYRITYDTQVSGVAGGERTTSMAPPFFITDLEPNTAYSVRVAAINDAGDGAPSDTESQDSPFGGTYIHAYLIVWFLSATDF